MDFVDLRYDHNKSNTEWKINLIPREKVSFTLYFINFQTNNENVLLSNQITGFSDHQYLWKEAINVLDFLYKDIYQWKILSKNVGLVCQAVQSTQSLVILTKVSRGPAILFFCYDSFWPGITLSNTYYLFSLHQKPKIISGVFVLTRFHIFLQYIFLVLKFYLSIF